MRRSIAMATALALAVPAVSRAQHEAWPDEWSSMAADEAYAPAEIAGETDACACCGDAVEETEHPVRPWWALGYLGLRHSHVHGRHLGIGQPLSSTSWLNRPYYVGADIGTLWVTEPPADNISRDIDMFGGLFAGCDWDHYWGLELGVHRATPEMMNSAAPAARRGDRLMLWTASLMYYPLGDAAFRPYLRCGMGATEIDYPTDAGNRHDETLWTLPLGIGMKYPLRRWLAARAEVADQLALGNTGIATQHNLTFTLGLEWRFGAHPRSYWPWNPHRHIW